MFKPTKLAKQISFRAILPGVSTGQNYAKVASEFFCLFYVIVVSRKVHPSWQMVHKLLRIDVNTTSSRHIDVNTTSFLRLLPAGIGLYI